MTDSEIVHEVTELFKNKTIEQLADAGFIHVFKCRIALIRKTYFDYVRDGESSMQAITNTAIDFTTSESTVMRYIYHYKSVNI